MAEKHSIIIYTDYKEQMKLLNDRDTAWVFRAIVDYASGEEIEETDSPMAKMFFAFIKSQMDRDTKKYEEVCKKRSEAGKKSANSKKASAIEEKQMSTNSTSVDFVQQTSTNSTDNDNENVNDNVNENENVNVNDNENENDYVNVYDNKNKNDYVNVYGKKEKGKQKLSTAAYAAKTTTTEQSPTKILSPVEELMAKYSGKNT